MSIRTRVFHVCSYEVSKQNSGYVCQFGLVSFTFVPMKFPNRTLGMYVNSVLCLTFVPMKFPNRTLGMYVNSVLCLTFVPMKFPNRTLGMYVNSVLCLPRLFL